MENKHLHAREWTPLKPNPNREKKICKFLNNSTEFQSKVKDIMKIKLERS